MKDKKLIIAAVLLPATLLFSGAALAAGRLPVAASGAVPTVQPVQGATCVEIPVELALSATDDDNDVVLYQLTEQPRLGTAVIEGATLTYSPGSKAGKDRFAYTAVDANGNTAKPAEITVTVEKNKSKLTYADMTDNPAHYAALRLSAAGVMTGERIGGCSFFRPNQPVTRSEFIAMAAAIADLPVEPTESTDFADDSGLSLWAKPFVSTAAMNGLVSGYRTANGVNEIRGQNPITLAEASVVLNNMLRAAADEVQLAAADDHATDMDWAQSAVSSLARIDVLSAQTAAQDSSAPITRQTACQMLYRTMTLLERP